MPKSKLAIPYPEIEGVLAALQDATDAKTVDGMPQLEVTAALTIIGKVLVFLMSPVPKEPRNTILDGWISAVKGAAEVVHQSEGAEGAEGGGITEEHIAAAQEAIDVTTQAQTTITETVTALKLSPEAVEVMRLLQKNCRPTSLEAMRDVPADEESINTLAALRIAAEVSAALLSTTPETVRNDLSAGYFMAIKENVRGMNHKPEIVRQETMRPN